MRGSRPGLDHLLYTVSCPLQRTFHGKSPKDVRLVQDLSWQVPKDCSTKDKQDIGESTGQKCSSGTSTAWHVWHACLDSLLLIDKDLHHDLRHNVSVNAWLLRRDDPPSPIVTLSRSKTRSSQKVGSWKQYASSTSEASLEIVLIASAVVRPILHVCS